MRPEVTPIAKFSPKTGARLTEARKPRAKKGRRQLSQAQREQIARYLGGGGSGWNRRPTRAAAPFAIPKGSPGEDWKARPVFMSITTTRQARSEGCFAPRAT